MKPALVFKAPSSATVSMAFTRDEVVCLQDAIDDALDEGSGDRSRQALRRLQRRLHAATGEEIPRGHDAPTADASTADRASIDVWSLGWTEVCALFFDEASDQDFEYTSTLMRHDLAKQLGPR